jgi:hypothetical protein
MNEFIFRIILLDMGKQMKESFYPPDIVIAHKLINDMCLGFKGIIK